MTLQDVFGRVVEALERAGIPYMLTGSFASAYHGVPRATQDIDIVIAPNPDQLRTFVSLLPQSDYYVDLEEAVEAHSRQTQFNVVDLSTGWKVDLIMRKLEWAKLGQSQRQIEDVAGILRIQSGRLDRAYIAKWVGDLKLGREWEAACRLAGIAAQ